MLIELFILSSIGRCRTVDKTEYILIQYLVYRSRLISRKKSLRNELSVPPNQPVRVFVFMLRSGLRLPVAVAIALAIALLIEFPIEFPMHLLIAFGCLVEAFWIFFHDFLIPFGSLLAPFGRLGRPFLDPGTTPGPFRAQDATSCDTNYNLVAIWLAPGSPN